MTATFHVGDAIEVMSKLPEKSVDLVISSPPFLALRSYLPSDHPDKALEGGSQATPGEYIDWLLDVVEACARVLAPHGSLCFELGDTYSGSGGAGGDYAADGLREGQPKFQQMGSREHRPEGTSHRSINDFETQMVPTKGGNGWPLAKSLSLIPESFRFAMVYGHNPHTGRRTEPWRLRNVIRWVRPNPPVGALGDKFRPATSELMVFCKAKDRYFDLDSVRSSDAYPPRAASGATLGASTLGPELRGALHTDHGSLDARWRCHFGQAEIPVDRPVARLAEGFEVVELVGLKVRIEQAEGPYVVDLKPYRSEVASPAAIAIAVERSLPGFLPIGSAVADSTTPPSGAVLASPIGRTPDAVALEAAEVLSVEGRLVAPDLLAARIALQVNGTVCYALLIVPVTASDHRPNSTGKPRNRQAEPAMGRGGNWNTFPNFESSHPAGAPPLDWWNIPLLEGEEPTPYGPKEQAAKRVDLGLKRKKTMEGGEMGPYFEGMNGGAPPLDWWNIPPGGYPGAHYAVWPPELLIKPIKAMCPESVCRVCGEPRRRIVENQVLDRFGQARATGSGWNEPDLRRKEQGHTSLAVTTLGFSDCGHDDWRPGLVLDCFAGSGTTLSVATGHGRDAIGIDLDERNYDLALDRVGPLILQQGVRP